MSVTGWGPGAVELVTMEGGLIAFHDLGFVLDVSGP